MGKLKWGLLSTARINRSVIPSIRLSKRSELVGVASRNLGTAEAYGKNWDIPLAFGSYEALVGDPGINVVYISLPNHLHAEWAIKCAIAGKHVLCEKPLALSAIDVDRIIEASRKRHVVVTEAFMYRHHPQTLMVMDLLNRQAIGNMLTVKGTFTFSLTHPNDVRLNPEMGGGSIWDVGCYPISYTRLVVAAEPVEVFGWQALGSTGVDEAFMGQLRFANGLLAQVESGFRSPYRTRMEFVGTTGSIEVNKPFKPELDSRIEIQYGDGAESIKIPNKDLYQGEIEDMENAVLDGKLQLISLETSRGNAVVINALIESAKTGRPVMLT